MSVWTPKRIISFGEVLWDILPDSRKLGGAPLNFAARVQALGNTVSLISSVGDDPLGYDTLGAIAELELSTDLVVTDPVHPTGTVPVEFVDGQPRYIITPDVAFDHIPLLKPMLDETLNADCIYFGTLIQRSLESRTTLHTLLKSAPQKTVKFVDLNLRPNCYDHEIIRWSVRHADIVKLNDEEVREVALAFGYDADVNSDGLSRLICEQWDVSSCVITLGPDGAVGASSVDGIIEVIREPGLQVNVADTIGAGDSFAAGYVHAWLNDFTLKDCLHLANRLGALAASKQGGTAKFTDDELDVAISGLSTEQA